MSSLNSLNTDNTDSEELFHHYRVSISTFSLKSFLKLSKYYTAYQSPITNEPIYSLPPVLIEKNSQIRLKNHYNAYEMILKKSQLYSLLENPFYIKVYQRDVRNYSKDVDCGFGVVDWKQVFTEKEKWDEERQCLRTIWEDWVPVESGEVLKVAQVGIRIAIEDFGFVEATSYQE